MNHPDLPQGAVYLGLGKSFRTDGPFEGWMCAGGSLWSADSCSGGNRNVHYAAPAGSAVATLNGHAPQVDESRRLIVIPDEREEMPLGPPLVLHPDLEVFKSNPHMFMATDVMFVEPPDSASTHDPVQETIDRRARELGGDVPGQSPWLPLIQSLSGPMPVPPVPVGAPPPPSLAHSAIELPGAATEPYREEEVCNQLHTEKLAKERNSWIGNEYRDSRAVLERDPHGLTSDTPGAKNDAGKPMASLLRDFGLALLAVAEVGTHGAAKYSRGGWLEVRDGQPRYADAGLRHQLRMGTEHRDLDSGLTHLAHAAWNALAELELHLRSQQP